MAKCLIRICYVLYELHYVPSSTIRTKRRPTVRDPEQSEKLPSRYTNRRTAIPHLIFWLKWTIQDDQRNINCCSRHGAILCAAAARFVRISSGWYVKTVRLIQNAQLTNRRWFIEIRILLDRGLNTCSFTRILLSVSEAGRDIGNLKCNKSWNKQ